MVRLQKHVTIIALCGVFAYTGPANAADWMNTLKGAVESVTKEQTGTGTASVLGLSSEDIVAGLKDALRVGVDTVTGQLGSADGFNGDANVHIPLPRELQTVQSTLRKIGMAAIADDVELKLNRGAEAAMPRAKELVWKAINEMTLEDAKGIYDGPNDAATQYFRRVATTDLKTTVSQVLDQTLQDVGAVAAYDQMIGQYKAVPFVPDVKANLTAHATQLALDGLFRYLAQEEAAIRQDPAKRTTDILTKVFGAR